MPDAAAPTPSTVIPALSRLFLSIHEVETVVYLRGNQSLVWDAPSLGRALRLPAQHARALLEALANRGFLRPAPGGYRYEPIDRDLAVAVAQVAALPSADRFAALSVAHPKEEQRAESRVAFDPTLDRSGVPFAGSKTHGKGND